MPDAKEPTKNNDHAMPGEEQSDNSLRRTAMPDAKPTKKVEDMTKAEIRQHIATLTPGKDFRVSQGVYVYRQKDHSLSYFVRVYYLGNKFEFWNHESQVEAEAFYTQRLLEIHECGKKDIRWIPPESKKQIRSAHHTANSMTIAEFGEWWHANVVCQKNPHTTQRKYKEYLQNHVYPFFDHGTRSMTSIIGFDLEQFTWAFKEKISARTGRKLKVSTLHTILRMLYGFFLVAKEKGVIADNPFTKSIKKIAGKKDAVKLDAFTPEQEAAFLAGVRRYEPEWFPLFLTLQRSAARTGEVLALKEEDLNFESRTIKIVRHLAEGKVLDKTKTKEGREIDMTKQLADELQQYLKRRHEEERIRGIRFEFLFGWEEDRPIAMRTLQEVYNSLRGFLDLPPVKLYGTRHTALARLFRETKDLPYTKMQAGHASIKSTLVYEQAMPREDKPVDCLDTPVPETSQTDLVSSESKALESASVRPPSPPAIRPESGINLIAVMQQFEDNCIQQALDLTKGNRKAAASLLGIAYDTLTARLRALRRRNAQNGNTSHSDGQAIPPPAA